VKAILENPYRVVGLLVGANAKEKEKKVRRLKHYIEAEQAPEADDSFSEKIPVLRTIETVNEAASKLNLDKDRMSAALFWFYNGNEVKDTMAFEAMKDGNYDQAITVWTKLTSSEISKTNASAYSNLATLYMSGLLNGALKKEKMYELGISLKLKFLNSDYARDLKQKATDETYKVTNKELQLMFLQQLHDDVILGKPGITLDMFLLIIMEQSFSAKDDFLRNFVQKPIDLIERKINETKSKRKGKPANAIEAAKSLLKETKDDFSQLEFVLKTSDIKYITAKDDIAEEVLQCGIDYFNCHREKNENTTRQTGKEDFAKNALEICQKAASIAVGKNAKNRCQENVDIMKNFIDQRKTHELIIKLKDLIEKYDRFTQNIDNAKQLISTTKPLLSSFKSEVGNDKESSDIYIGFSTRIASDALGMCVTEINKLQENAGNIDLLKRKINDALGVMNQIESMDLQSDFRINRFNENKKALEDLKQVINRPPPPGQNELEQLQKLIDKYDHLPQTIDNAKTLISTAKPLLSKFYSEVGNDKKLNEVYISISTRIASDALGMCIAEINKFQENAGNIDLFKQKVNDALEIMRQFDYMDLLPDFKSKRINENKKALEGLLKSLAPPPGQAEIEQLKNLIDRYQGRSETVDNAKEYISLAKPALQKVKSVLGANNEIYMALSTRIASDAMGMCVSEINSAQGQIRNQYNGLERFKDLVDHAIKVIAEIGKMDMLDNFRKNFNANLSALGNLYQQINPGYNLPREVGAYRNSNSSRKSGPCYIATMAYGDYNHPQVMVLRDFRDQFLYKYVLGQWFIRNYYRYSPKLVEALKDKKTINSFIRMLLNQFIKLIK